MFKSDGSWGARTFGPYCTISVTSLGKLLTCAWPQRHVTASVRSSMTSNTVLGTSMIWCRSGYLGLLQRQRAVAAHALRRQRMIDSIGRFGDAFERRALVATLDAGWLARWLAQRVRLLGQSIRRWRLARIVAGLVDLRLQRVQARQQTQNERVLLFVREDGQVGSWSLFCHASMMNVSGTVYNLFIAVIAAEQSPLFYVTFGRRNFRGSLITLTDEHADFPCL